MDDESYEEGDFIAIYDRQKANMTISMSADIEEGIVIQVKRKYAGMLICEKVEPTEQVEVKPFPPTSGSSFIVQSDEGLSQAKSEKKVLEENTPGVVSDVADFLSEDQKSKSDTLK